MMLLLGTSLCRLNAATVSKVGQGGDDRPPASGPLDAVGALPRARRRGRDPRSASRRRLARPCCRRDRRAPHLGPNPDAAYARALRRAGGALARDGTRWLPARPTFLFPVRALAHVSRGRYLAGRRRPFDRGDLHLTGALATLAEPAAFAAWLDELRAQGWVVYCKLRIAAPEHDDDY